MGHYELHVTVRNDPEEYAYRNTNATDLMKTFAAYCHDRMQCKSNLIELQHKNGARIDGPTTSVSQLMLAKKSIFENDEQALKWGRDMTDFLELEGWHTVRTKVESPLCAGQSTYFEAHWKLKYPQLNARVSTPVTEPLAEFLHVAPDIYLRSRNMGHLDTHYLSMRSYQPDFGAAQQHFDRGDYEIHESGLPLEGVHYERVLVDTNPELDKDWVS